MNMNENTKAVLDICPNCKKAPAVMGSTEWGHIHACCSKKCGMEFLNSPDRIKAEILKVKRDMKYLYREMDELIDRFIKYHINDGEEIES